MLDTPEDLDYRKRSSLSNLFVSNQDHKQQRASVTSAKIPKNSPKVSSIPQNLTIPSPFINTPNTHFSPQFEYQTAPTTNVTSCPRYPCIIYNPPDSFGNPAGHSLPSLNIIAFHQRNQKNLKNLPKKPRKIR